MKKKNGFISMTLVYTFLILFMFLMLAILRTYTEKDKFLQAINDQIDSDIGSVKVSRVTVINRLLDDNMPSSDANIKYFKIANHYYGNGAGLYYMDTKNYENYNLNELTDENDDGHTSRIYYFRGSVENNHLVFANMCFRIIRTNEDGSVRIVYNGPNIGDEANPKCKKISNPNLDDIVIGNTQFNETGLVQYVNLDPFGKVPSADENNAQSNVIPILNTWYSDNFINGFNNKNYTEYISKDTIFCNNKNEYNSTNYYQSRELSPIRIDESDLNIYNDSNYRNTISFKCENDSDRFSVTDGNLLYPIGLLTAQDVVLAGGYLDIGSTDPYKGGVEQVIKNESFYLYSSNAYWTMSPLSNDGQMIYVNAEGTLKGSLATANHNIRPVISLKSNISLYRGDGTADNPYIVKTDD